jgi:O-antigen/teichoic acid export membrane protein
MGYKKDVIKGVSWYGFLRIATKVIGFLEAIILARILAPEQFGAYAVALLALGMLEVLTETGVNIFLVQEKSIDKYINSAWIVSILRGIIIMIILLLTAPVISNFFHSPESLALLYFISFVPLIRGFINPSIVKFQKDLLFGKDFWFRFIILVIDTAVSIIFTVITQNPMGIVIGLITGVFVETVLSYFVVSPRPRFQIEKDYISKIFHRGKWITASTVFDYLFHNADNIVVGRLLGAASLGVYQLAYSIAVMPLSEVGKVFLHVVMPILVKIANDSSRLKSAFLKTVLSIGIITLIPSLVIFFFPQIFVWILGEKWSSLTSVLPVLAALGFVKSLSAAPYTLFLSSKKQEYTTVVTLITILGLVIPILPLVQLYGLFGAGLSALIGSVLAIPFLIYYTFRILRSLPLHPEKIV